MIYSQNCIHYKDATLNPIIIYKSIVSIFIFVSTEKFF